MTFDSDTQDFDQVFKPGLGLIPETVFAPHWDMVDSWMPGARAAITSAAPPGGVLVGLDEDTAMVGDGSSWRVEGRQGVHVYRSGAMDPPRRGGHVRPAVAAVAGGRGVAR